MRLDVGPVEPGSAVAWIQWADRVLTDLSIGALSPEAVAGMMHYCEIWRPRTKSGTTFRWHSEVDPDEVEFLLVALLHLDAHPSVPDCIQRVAPDEGRLFYLVLVRELLHALEIESMSRAAFVDQLRSSWLSAAEAS